MVHAHRGNYTKYWINDVGSVISSSTVHLHNSYVHTLAQKIEKGCEYHFLSSIETDAAFLDQLENNLSMLNHGFHRYELIIDSYSFSERADVRGDVSSALVARFGESS